MDRKTTIMGQIHRKSQAKLICEQWSDMDRYRLKVCWRKLTVDKGLGLSRLIATNMYGIHSCYSHVPVLQYSYCMPFEYSLSLYQCTLLPICTVTTVQLLYAIPILTVNISVHIVTNMYGSHSTVTVMPFQSSLSLYQCTLLPICTVATVQLLYAIPILTVNHLFRLQNSTSCSFISLCHHKTLKATRRINVSFQFNSRCM